MALVLFAALRSSASILEVPFCLLVGENLILDLFDPLLDTRPFEQVLYFKVPRRSCFQTGIWTGDLLAAFFVLLVLAVSRSTFRYVEDPPAVARRGNGPRALAKRLQIVQQGMKKAI